MSTHEKHNRQATVKGVKENDLGHVLLPLFLMALSRYLFEEPEIVRTGRHSSLTTQQRLDALDGKRSAQGVFQERNS